MAEDLPADGGCTGLFYMTLSKLEEISCIICFKNDCTRKNKIAYGDISRFFFPEFCFYFCIVGETFCYFVPYFKILLQCMITY